MLPTISDFFKDTFGESLKKPLQPAGLFAAAIFLLLNLVFVFPFLIEQHNAVATAFLGLSTAWQIVLVSILALVLAYLLLSMSTTILKLMTGELWATSPLLGKVFKERNKQRHKKRNDSIIKDDQGRQRRFEDLTPEELQELWELSTIFPKDGRYMAPTALGNVLNATAIEIWQRYQIDMTALWPHMETVIAEKTPLVSRLDNEKATLDFLVNLAFVLGAFALEYGLLCLWSKQWLSLLWLLVFIVLVYIVYRAAVSKALSWGDVVQMVFDLHRDELRTALGLRDCKSRAEERQVWEKASRWLLWGPQEKEGETVHYDEIFKDEPEPTVAPALSYRASPNVKVEIEDRIRILQKDALERSLVDGALESVMLYDQYIEYVVLVSNTGETEANGVHLIIFDSRVLPMNRYPSVDNQEDWKDIKVMGSIIRADKQKPTDAVLWRISHLPPNSARMLCYRLPACGLIATTNNSELSISAIRRDIVHILPTYTFSLKNKGKDRIQDAALHVSYAGIVVPHPHPTGELKVNDLSKSIAPQAVDSPSGYRWDLGEVGTDQSVALSYDMPKQRR